MNKNNRVLMIAMRHANRNPEKFLELNRDWGQEGEMMLNQVYF